MKEWYSQSISDELNFKILLLVEPYLDKLKDKYSISAESQSNLVDGIIKIGVDLASYARFTLPLINPSPSLGSKLTYTSAVRFRMSMQNIMSIKLNEFGSNTPTSWNFISDGTDVEFYINLPEQKHTLPAIILSDIIIEHDVLDTNKSNPINTDEVAVNKLMDCLLIAFEELKYEDHINTYKRKFNLIE